MVLLYKHDLEAIVGDKRPSRASVRRVAEVTFPDRVTFPFKQRLTLQGAIRDANVPEPRVSEDDDWEAKGHNFRAKQTE